jgi:hypothetical protein
VVETHQRRVADEVRDVLRVAHDTHPPASPPGTPPTPSDVRRITSPDDDDGARPGARS